MEPTRRKLLTGASVAGVFAAASLSKPNLASATELGDHVLTVGPAGTYPTIAAAATQAANLAPDVNNHVVILLLPGTYALTANVALPSYTTLTGIDRDACIISTTGTSTGRILYGYNCTLANFTFRFASTAGGAFNTIDHNSLTGTAVDTWLELNNLRLENTHIGAGAVIRLVGNRYVRFNACEIATSSVGILCSTTNTVSVNNCNIWLLDIQSNTDHIGIKVAGYVRLQVRTSKIASGYGPYNWTSANQGITGQPSQNIYGVFVASTGSAGTRVELYEVWSIVRNETGASAGINTSVVRIEGMGIVRIFGGYLQAEDGGADQGNRYDVANAPPNGQTSGQVQLIGNCAIGKTFGQIDGMSGTLMVTRYINAAATLTSDSDAMFLADTSAGSFAITLPSVPSVGERYIFKRIAGNGALTIAAGSGKTIDGAASIQLGAAIYSRVEIQFGAAYQSSPAAWYVIG